MKSFLLRNLPDEVLKNVKIKAAEKGITMRDLILLYIEEGLRREGAHGKG